MDNNQLGRNIQHLRIIYNETLDELGSVIHCAKSTVKGYENGSRKPDLQTLQLLATHYHIIFVLPPKITQQKIIIDRVHRLG